MNLALSAASFSAACRDDSVELDVCQRSFDCRSCTQHGHTCKKQKLTNTIIGCRTRAPMMSDASSPFPSSLLTAASSLSRLPSYLSTAGTYLRIRRLSIRYFTLISLLIVFFSSSFSPLSAQSSSSPSPILRLGLLNGWGEITSAQAVIAQLLAIQHVNTRNFTVLPALNSTIHPALRIEFVNVNSYISPLDAAVDLRRTNQLHAVVGDMISDRCITTQHALGPAGVPQISPACTASRLLDKSEFPTFFRMVPSDDQQGLVLSTLCKTLRWRRVVVLAGSDTYSQGVAGSFLTDYAAFGTVLLRVDVPITSTDVQLWSYLAQVQASGGTIIVACFSTIMLTRVLNVTTSSPDLSLNANTYAWIGPDGFINTLPTSAAAQAATVGNIGTSPYNGYDTQPYATLLNMWPNINLTDPIFNFTGASPSLLNSFPHYMPKSYDAVWLLASIASNLLYTGQNITSQGIMRAFTQNLTYTGVSGTIRWDTNGNTLGLYSLVNKQAVNTSSGATNTAGVSASAISVVLGVLDASNLQIPQSLINTIRFHDGTNIPPSSQIASLVLTFLLSGRMAGNAVPLDDLLLACVWNGQTWTSSSGRKYCNGGFGRRATYVKSRRAVSANTIVVDSGGSFFGTPYQDLDDGKTMAKLFDAAGYDVYDSGVSDFFLTDIFSAFINALPRKCEMSSGVDSGMCVVTSNLDIHLDAGLTANGGTPLIRRWLVKTMRDGQLVGFVGVVQTNLATQVRLGDVKVGFGSTDDPLLRMQLDVQNSIDQMTSTFPSCNVIILIGDQNGDFINILPNLPQVDLALTVLALPTISPATFGLTTKEGLVYYYPKRPLLPIIHMDTLILTRFTDVTMSFSTSGDLILDTIKAVQTNLTSDIPDDPIAGPLMYGAYDAVTKRNAVVLTTITAAIDGGRGSASIVNGDIKMVTDGCRVSDCQMGTIITEAILSEGCTDCWFAHINSGGVRAGLTYRDGNVTRGDLFTVLPFSNYMHTYNMKGVDVQTMIQSLLTQWNSGNWPQMSGIHVAFSSAGAKTATAFKVIYIELLNPTTKKYEVLDVDATYKIATNDFVPYVETTIITKATNLVTSGPILLDMTVSYMQKLATRVIPSRTEMASCAFDTLSLAYDVNSGVVGKLIWPTDYSDCRIVRANQAPFTPCGTNEVRVVQQNGLAACICIAGYTRLLASTGEIKCLPCPKNMVKQYQGNHPCVCDQGYYNISALTYARQITSFTPAPLNQAPTVSGDNSTVSVNLGSGLMILNLLSCTDLGGTLNFPDPIAVPLNFSGNSTGLWQLIPLEQTCQPCPVCMQCARDPEATSDYNITTVVKPSFVPAPSFWWTGQSSVIYSCPLQGGLHCLGKDVNACADGYTGYLCQVCADGYGSVDGSDCGVCPTLMTARAMLGLVALGVLCYLALTIRSAFSATSFIGVATKQFTNFLHVNTFIFRFQLSDSSILTSMSGLIGFASIGGSQSISYSCAWTVDALDVSFMTSMMILILLGIALINRFFSCTCKSRWKTYRRESTQNLHALAIDKTMVEMPKVAPPSGSIRRSNRRVSFIAATPENNKQRVEFRAFPTCVVLLFLLYPSVVQESLSLIRSCWRIDDNLVLVSDFRVHCDTTRFQMWRVIAWIKFLVIGVGFPLVLFISLYRREKAEMLYEPAFFVRYRFLFEGYRLGLGYWESIILLRQFFIACVAVMLSEQPSVQAFLTCVILVIACLVHTFKQPFDSKRANELETLSLFCSLLVLAFVGMAGAKQHQQEFIQAVANTIGSEGVAAQTRETDSAIPSAENAFSGAASRAFSAHTYSWGEPVIWFAILAVAVNIAFCIAVIYSVWPHVQSVLVNTRRSILAFFGSDGAQGNDVAQQHKQAIDAAAAEAKARDGQEEEQGSGRLRSPSADEGEPEVELISPTIKIDDVTIHTNGKGNVISPLHSASASADMGDSHFTLALPPDAPIAGRTASSSTSSTSILPQLLDEADRRQPTFRLVYAPNSSSAGRPLRTPTKGRPASVSPSPVPPDN